MSRDVQCDVISYPHKPYPYEHTAHRQVSLRRISGGAV